MGGRLTAIVLSTALIGQSIGPVMAQTRDRPVPLPGPVPDRPVPLPRPIPDRPQIQPPRPGPGYPGYDQNRGYAGRINCSSRGSRQVRCNAPTENRVALLSGSACSQGRTWGYDRRSIWVSHNCRGTFAYGYGNDWGNTRPPDNNKGPSTGLIIGGVAVAAGLIALLASSKGKSSPAAQTSTPATPSTYPPGPPAQISADLSSIPANARPSMQTCLSEAAREIGATGGSRLRFDRVKTIEAGNGGWRFAADLVATYPDGDKALPIYCRATPSKVIQLDFTS
jgi:hypothetical protein